MPIRRNAPVFAGSIESWAAEVSRFLDELTLQSEGLEPKAILFTPQQAGTVYKATEDGVVMFHAARKELVFSKSGEWQAITSYEAIDVFTEDFSSDFT